MHASVALAAVCGVADEAKGELAKAYVMLKPGASASGKELVEHCRQHLAAYKLPARRAVRRQRADHRLGQDHAPAAEGRRRRHPGGRRAARDAGGVIC